MNSNTYKPTSEAHSLAVIVEESGNDVIEPVTPKDSHLRINTKQNILKRKPDSTSAILSDGSFKWKDAKNVLILIKPNDRSSKINALKLTKWLFSNKKEFVNKFYIDSNLSQSLAKSQLVDDLNITYNTFSLQDDDIDVVFTFGGDGSVLHASCIFQRKTPVIISFNTGSMGFLTPFEPLSLSNIMSELFVCGKPITVRKRLSCKLYRYTGIYSDNESELCFDFDRNAVEESSLSETSGVSSTFEQLKTDAYEHKKTVHILNDVVVEKSYDSNMSMIDVYTDNGYITTVQGDGLTISTPTGSTAYSLSAGGSLVHPSMSAILLTPNCPHSLSFRPMILPDTTSLYLHIPFVSRSKATVSFDGKNKIELNVGDYVKVETSKYNFNILSNLSTEVDWKRSLRRCLNWNHRVIQKTQEKDIDLSSDA